MNDWGEIKLVKKGDINIRGRWIELLKQVKLRLERTKGDEALEVPLNSKKDLDSLYAFVNKNTDDGEIGMTRNGRDNVMYFYRGCNYKLPRDAR